MCRTILVADATNPVFIILVFKSAIGLFIEYIKREKYPIFSKWSSFAVVYNNCENRNFEKNVMPNILMLNILVY